MRRSLPFLGFLIALIGASVSFGRPTLAVVDFGSVQETSLTRTIPSLLVDLLVDAEAFEIFERERLDALLEEQGLQISGALDPETVVRLGKLSGIDYLLTGEVIDFGRESKTFSGYGVRTVTDTYRLDAAVRVIDVQTGRVVFSRSPTVKEVVNQGGPTRLSDSTMDTKLARQLAELVARALLSSDVVERKPAPAATVPVKITSTPPLASVEVNGVFFGNTGTVFQLTPGLQVIRVSLPGYDVWEKKVNVGEATEFHVPLTKTTDLRIEVE